MSDGYLQNTINGGYVGGSYYSGADPSAFVAPLILSQMQSNQGAPTDTFQYYQSMFNRVNNAQEGGGSYTPGTLTDTTLGSLNPNSSSAMQQTSGAVGTWLFSQIMTPRFIVFAVGGVLIIVALFSLAKPVLGIAEQGVSVAQRVRALKGGD